MRQKFLEDVQNRDAVIGIIGLGYVGLPLLIEFTKPGFRVVGFDVDDEKIRSLEAGESYIRHIESGAIRAAISDNPTGAVTADFSRICECSAILICVPTPLNEHKEPDLTYIIKTADGMAPHLSRGQLVILESTTYPGTTEEVLIPRLEGPSQLKAGVDFFVAYSPEREDPNNTQFRTATIPKVVGGLNDDSLAVARALYDTIICETIPVSSCRAAEATKLMENIFRCVNIALVNELKIVFSKMRISIWEVINAAKTKPFGFMPFYPGPGLGGHCIPIDPFYLTWKAREYGISTRFIELAGEINTNMPHYVLQQTMMALNDRRKSLNGSRVLLVGLAYKKNVDDVRESPTFVLWELLAAAGASVAYLDPYVPAVKPTREYSRFMGIRGKTLDDLRSETFDAAIIATDHDNIDYDELTRLVDVVIDTRNACKIPKPNVYQA